MADRILLAGTGTDVGKTVVSSILVEAMGWDYWKPISAVPPGEGDCQMISEYVTRTDVTIHDSAYDLDYPQSPHAAAKLTGVELQANAIRPPQSSNTLLMEMAGGVLVPINNQQLLIDALAPMTSGAIIVSRHQLGSINHTLLTVEALRARNIPIYGLIFNGKALPHTVEFLLYYTDLPCIGHLDEEAHINAQVIQRYATLWKEQLPSPSPTT